jgi:hypothetical protein
MAATRQITLWASLGALRPVSAGQRHRFAQVLGAVIAPNVALGEIWQLAGPHGAARGRTGPHGAVGPALAVVGA